MKLAMTLSDGIALVVASGGFLAWLFERIGKLGERRARIAAETELDRIKRSGEGPYLRPEQMIAYHGTAQMRGKEEPRQIDVKHATERIADIAPNGAKIHLHIGNVRGKTVRSVRGESAEGLVLCPVVAGELDARQSVAIIVYDLVRNKIGQPQRLEIKCESMGGIPIRQTYEVTHGICEIKRVEPL